MHSASDAICRVPLQADAERMYAATGVASSAASAALIAIALGALRTSAGHVARAAPEEEAAEVR